MCRSIGIKTFRGPIDYGKTEKFEHFDHFSHSFLRTRIHKTLARIANRRESDQTASSEAVWSGSALFVYIFLTGN